MPLSVSIEPHEDLTFLDPLTVRNEHFFHVRRSRPQFDVLGCTFHGAGCVNRAVEPDDYRCAAPPPTSVERASIRAMAMPIMPIKHTAAINLPINGYGGGGPTSRRRR